MFLKKRLLYRITAIGVMIIILIFATILIINGEHKNVNKTSEINTLYGIPDSFEEHTLSNGWTLYYGYGENGTAKGIIRLKDSMVSIESDGMNLDELIKYAESLKETDIIE